MTRSSLSRRGALAAATPLRIDFELYEEAVSNRYHPRDNPDGAFPLNVAENTLGWHDLKRRIEAVTSTNSIPDWVPGYTSTLGAPDFRTAVAEFLAEHLTGCPVDPGHLGVSAGATSVIEMTSFILAEAGDVAVIPAPCYPVYRQDIGGLPGVVRYDLVTHHEPSQIAAGPVLTLEHLDQARREIEGAGKRFRMLILTNPDNPTGGIYSRPLLEEIAGWCVHRGIHLVVNEIYGLSLIDTTHPAIRDDYAGEAAFYSFANVMREMESDYLHLWYAFSKDLGISGMRVGLVYSQNADLLQAYENLNLSHTVSNHSQWILQLLLGDTDFMTPYIAENRVRLTESYVVVVRHLKSLGIPYVPARGSLFVWLDLSELLGADTPEAESDLWMELYRSAGVLLTPGVGFGHTKRGLFRLVHPCVSKADLEVAMERFSRFVVGKRQDVS